MLVLMKSFFLHFVFSPFPTFHLLYTFKDNFNYFFKYNTLLNMDHLIFNLPPPGCASLDKG